MIKRGKDASKLPAVGHPDLVQMQHFLYSSGARRFAELQTRGQGAPERPGTAIAFGTRLPPSRSPFGPAPYDGINDDKEASNEVSGSA